MRNLLFALLLLSTLAAADAPTYDWVSVAGDDDGDCFFVDRVPTLRLNGWYTVRAGYQKQCKGYIHSLGYFYFDTKMHTFRYREKAEWLAIEPNTPVSAYEQYIFKYFGITEIVRVD